MTMMERKAFRADLKAGDRGEVEAHVATVNTPDREGDLLRPSAVPNGAFVKMARWGLNLDKSPVGKGTLTVDGDKLRFSGKLFLSTGEGRETFETLRAMGDDCLWEFAYQTVKSEAPSSAERQRGARRVLTKVAPLAVAPTLFPVSPDTGTLSAKSPAEIQVELQRVQFDMERRQREWAAKDAAAVKANAAAASLKALREQTDPRRHGEDAFDRFEKLLAFGFAKLKIAPPEWPVARIVPRFCFPFRDGDTKGVYQSGLVAAADDLDEDQTEITLLHETAHHWEALHGKEHNEFFAEWMALDMHDEWRARRDASRAWRAA